MTAYASVRVTAGEQRPCDPFELTRETVVDGARARLLRFVVTGKRGLDREGNYADVPVVAVEELVGKDSLGAELWCEFNLCELEPQVLARLVGQVVMAERARGARP